MLPRESNMVSFTLEFQGHVMFQSQIRPDTPKAAHRYLSFQFRLRIIRSAMIH